jgi:hypothetical protein
MMPEDQSAFLKFVQEVDPVVVAFRDGEAAEIEPLTDTGSATNRTLCLWNRELQPKLDRKWIEDPGYYRVDGLKTSTLEFVPSLRSTWEGKDALVQGRLFGDFDKHLGKAAEFEEWYESIVRWIRKNYEKSPATSGGYVGPAAYFIYQAGGYLLPNFVPPRTAQWLAEIGKQHRQPA